jgi:hypothetical protein
MMFGTSGYMRRLSPSRSGPHVNGLSNGVVDEFSPLFLLLFDVLLLFRSAKAIEVQAGDESGG